jgi:hypothetical protein
MHALFRVALGASLVATALATPAAADEEELYAGDHVDGESFFGVSHEILSYQWLNFGDDYLLNVRTTLDPGAVIPESAFNRRWSSTVAQGELIVVVIEGSVPDGKKGRRHVYEAGSTLYADEGHVLKRENHSLLPVEVLSAVVVDVDHDPITRAADVPRFDQAFNGRVAKRIVLKGLNFIDEPYRVVVRDRSGRLVAARMPTPRESDWAWAGTHTFDEIGFVAGDPYLPGSRLMVGWISFPCGPDAIIDVGEDLVRSRSSTGTTVPATRLARGMTSC